MQRSLERIVAVKNAHKKAKDPEFKKLWKQVERQLARKIPIH